MDKAFSLGWARLSAPSRAEREESRLTSCASVLARGCARSSCLSRARVSVARRRAAARALSAFRPCAFFRSRLHERASSLFARVLSRRCSSSSPRPRLLDSTRRLVVDVHVARRLARFGDRAPPRARLGVAVARFDSRFPRFCSTSAGLPARTDIHMRARGPCCTSFPLSSAAPPLRSRVAARRAGHGYLRLEP